MSVFARFISWVFHPLFMPVYTLLLANVLSPRLIALPSDMRSMFFGFIAMITILFPALTMLYFKWMGTISSLQMPDRRERLAPFFVTLLFYGVCYYRLMNLPIDSVVQNMLLGAMLALALSLLITFSKKISIHMVGIGGLIGGILGLAVQHGLYNMLYLICALLVLAGIIGTSRLLLKAHKQGEVYLGFLLGVASVFLTVLLNVSRYF